MIKQQKTLIFSTHRGLNVFRLNDHEIYISLFIADIVCRRIKNLFIAKSKCIFSHMVKSFLQRLSISPLHAKSRLWMLHMQTYTLVRRRELLSTPKRCWSIFSKTFAIQFALQYAQVWQGVMNGQLLIYRPLFTLITFWLLSLNTAIIILNPLVTERARFLSSPTKKGS